VEGEVVGGVFTKRLRALDPDCEGYRSWGWIATLWVEPEHRWRGLGSQLLRWAETYLLGNIAGGATGRGFND